MSRPLSTGSHAGRVPKKIVKRKVVIIGDGAVGKSSMAHVYVQGAFPEVYEPTVFENQVTELWVEDYLVELSIWDTAGQEDFDKLRTLSYADSHFIIICYSVDSPDSLENVETKWIHEVVEQCPGVKVALVALKCDLREDKATLDKLAQEGASPVLYEQGLAVARRIRASRYLECSAKHNRGVREAFEEVAKVALDKRAKGQTRGSRSDEDADFFDKVLDKLARCIVS